MQRLTDEERAHIVAHIINLREFNRREYGPAVSGHMNASATAGILEVFDGLCGLGILDARSGLEIRRDVYDLCGLDAINVDADSQKARTFAQS